METCPDIRLRGPLVTQKQRKYIAWFDRMQASNAQQLSDEQTSSLMVKSAPVDAQLAAAWGIRAPERFHASFDATQGLKPASPLEKLAISSACDFNWDTKAAAYIRRTFADVERHETVKTQKWDESLKINVTTWATRYSFGNRRSQSPQDAFGRLDQIHEDDLRRYRDMWAIYRGTANPEIPEDKKLTPRQLDWLISQCGPGTTIGDLRPSRMVESSYSSASAIEQGQISDGEPPHDIIPVRRVDPIVDNRNSENDNEHEYDGRVNERENGDDYDPDHDGSSTDRTEVCVHSCEFEQGDTTHDLCQKSSIIPDGQGNRPGMDSSQLPESVTLDQSGNNNGATANENLETSGSQRGDVTHDTELRNSSDQHGKDDQPIFDSPQHTACVALDQSVNNKCFSTGVSLDLDGPQPGHIIHASHQQRSSGPLGAEYRPILSGSECPQAEFPDPSELYSLFNAFRVLVGLLDLLALA